LSTTRLKAGNWYVCENAHLTPSDSEEFAKYEGLYLSRKGKWLFFYKSEEHPTWISAGVPFLVLRSGTIKKTFHVVSSRGPSGWICPDYRLLRFKKLA
jgi:hypothetical protein